MGDHDVSGTLRHGFWFVAYLDLLGIRRALLKTDFLPGPDVAKERELVEALKASVGVIRDLRRYVATCFDGLAASDKDDHIRGVHDGFLASMSVMLVQLAAGHPIRGGIDVATGIEVDGELFGAAYVRAYELESKRARYPRLVVGEGVVPYLQASMNVPGDEDERRVERSMAEECLAFVKKDTDGELMVDYARACAHQRLLGEEPGATLLREARAFARRERARFQGQTDPESLKLFERYSQLVRSLDASGP